METDMNIAYVDHRTNKFIKLRPFYYCFCWRFGNRCCLRRNDCPPGVDYWWFTLP